MSDPDAPEGATPASGNPTPGKHSTRADADAAKAAKAAEAAEAPRPKRKAKVKKRHTVGRVLLASAVVLALVTGLGTVYLYRHLNGNLDVIDIEQQLTNRPEKKHVEGPHEPVNVLVMGSDDRDAPGNNIDNLTGGGKRSDTTILLHLSADRKRAYGVSIPRDSLVDRPDCKDEDLNTIPGASDVMWNEAFSVGGPACTVQQVETLTGIRVDHFVVVDFAGFRGMVDAIGGVQVCIPEPIVDPAHGINLPAGTRKLKGFQALNYVRERYVVGDGSDIGRMKRQQAFIASMAHQVISANTLANPIRLVQFLEAATQSLTLDDGLDNLAKIADLGAQFKGIGLDKIQFITVPWQYAPEDPNRIRWLPGANVVWQSLINDTPIPPKFLDDAISAQQPPGSPTPTPSGSPTSTPSGTPSSTPSGTPTPTPTGEATEDAERNGLCA